MNIDHTKMILGNSEVFKPRAEDVFEWRNYEDIANLTDSAKDIMKHI